MFLLKESRKDLSKSGTNLELFFFRFVSGLSRTYHVVRLSNSKVANSVIPGLFSFTKLSLIKKHNAFMNYTQLQYLS